jgi:S-DNA-T family DNA segregation ATPase FtsK/SpoIIIE
LKRRNISLDSRQREILGLLLLALGVLTLLSLLNITPGIVSGWWAGFLRRLFGWGAYPVALALGVAGGILLGHNLQPGNIIGWKMVIGLELVFLVGLSLAHLLSPNPDPLQLARDGGGGGYVGWAISSVLSQFLGLVTALLILLVTATAGVILTFDLSLGQIRHGLALAWEAGLSFYRYLRPPAVT